MFISILPSNKYTYEYVYKRPTYVIAVTIFHNVVLVVECAREATWRCSN